VARLGGRAIALPHARARISNAPPARAPAAAPSFTGVSASVDQIPKAPALPTLNFGSSSKTSPLGTALPKTTTTSPALPKTTGASLPLPKPSLGGALPKTAPTAAALPKSPPASVVAPKEEPVSAPSEGLDPTVLLVGAGEKFTPAFQAALARHRVFVEIANPEAVVEAVVTTAPDLVLLMGDAARDCGSDLLAKLAELPRNFSVPVVILEDATELDSKLRAFRSGATAIIPRSASVDATAEQVAKLARQIPEQGTENVGLLGEATLEDFVSALSKQLRSELVSVVSPEGKDGDAVRLVLGRGRPLAEFMDLFVRRVRRHVLLAEPLRYELDEPGTSPGIEGSVRPRIEPKNITNLRVILADDDTPRADSVAQELRKRGATVIVTDLDPTDARFERLRQVDPTVLMIGESHVHGAGHSLLRRMRQDTRLRWASQLVVRWEEVWSDRTGELGIQRFESTLAGLAEPETSLKSRAELRMPFDTRLETIGPARCLRSLSTCGHSLRVTVENPRAAITVDLSDGLIVGAEGRSIGDDPKTFEGANALSALLLLGSGRVHVEAVDQPATANVMAPVDVALNMADAEAPPIAPSIPAAGAVSIHPPFQGAPLAEVPLAKMAVTLSPAPVIPVQATPGTTLRPALLPAPESLSPAPDPAPAPGIAQPAPTESAFPPEQVTYRPAPEPAPGPAELATVRVQPDAPPPAGWQRLLARSHAWYSEQNSKLHAPRLSLSTAGLLLVLAILQGLMLVALYAGARALGLFSTTEEAAAIPAAVVPAKPAEPHVTPKPPATESVAPTPAVVPRFRQPDGSGRTVKDCEALFANNPLQNGYYPGAAAEQSSIGRKSIVQGDLQASRAAYCKAVHWDPRNLDYNVQLAQVLLLERDGAKALVYAERAAAIDPNPQRVQEVLGDALARVGAEEEARRAWYAAASLDPTSAESTRLLVSREVRQADTALKRRNLVVAEKFFRRASILEPLSTSSMVGLSYVLVQLEDMAGAAFWARRAVKLAPRSPQARLALGDALHAANDTRAAIAEWREASLLDPGNGEALKRLRRAGVPRR
jgi:tetratricopeptide (TPR) repeat protein/DNA-binding NarL/FixJ family response regulator